MASIQSYRDLIVWQKSMNLVDAVYRLTASFPKSEMYELTAQMRSSAVSIPSNIAEGRMRGTRKDYRKFLIQAYGSGGELETQIEISKRLKYRKEIEYIEVNNLLGEVMKMLNRMIKTLNTKPNLKPNP